MHAGFQLPPTFLPVAGPLWTRQRVLFAACFLMVLATLVQAWVVRHTSLPALDAVGFVWHAQAIERNGLLPTLHRETSPPLHPALIHGLHEYVNPVHHPWSWGLCAQLAAALPVVICPLAAYLWGRSLVGDAAAFAGAVCLSLITELARLGGDGLGDAAALLGWIGALACAGRWVRDQAISPGHNRWLAWAGAIVGITLLARGEILVLWLAIGLVTTCVVKRSEHAPAAIVCLSVGLLATVLPYLAVCQVTSPTDAMRHMVQMQGPSETTPLNVSVATSQDDTLASSPADAIGLSPTFGRKDTSTSSRFHGAIATLSEFVYEFGQASHVLLLLAVVGVWAARRSHQQIFVLNTVVAGLFTSAVLFVAYRGGYLSGRHLLPLVVMLVPWAGLGIVRIAHQLQSWTPRGSSRWAYPLVLTVLAIICGSTTVRPLHANRVALRQAAEWLMEQPDRSTVLDSYGTTALFTGRKTYRYDDAPTALMDPLLGYVVVEADELQRDSHRGATMRAMLDRYAERAAQFTPGELRGPTVLIYRWSAARFALATGDAHARKR